MNSFYYFLYLFSNKKHRHLVKNDALGVIYNFNLKGRIIIQFTAFLVKKNALALEKGALSLQKYLVICTCIWNSIYDKDIILIYLKKNSNIY